MKKTFIFILLTLVMLTALIACSNGDLETPGGPSPEPTEAVENESPTPEGENNESPTPESTPAQTAAPYEDDNYIYNREVLEFTAYDDSNYETGIFTLPSVRGQTPAVTCMEPDGTLYTIAMSNDAPVFSEIGKYCIEDQQYTPLITLDDGNSLGYMLGFGEDYIVWRELILSGEQVIMNLHLCNKSGAEDEVIYSDEINAQIGNVYVEESNPVVVLGSKIFFDTILGYDDEGFIMMDVLCYDAEKKEISVVAEMAKRPSPYLDGISYLKRGENNESLLYANIDGEETFITEFGDDTADYTVIGETVYKSLFNFYDPVSVTSTNIYVGDETQPLLEGKTANYTYHIHGNESVMVWEITNPEKPVYYDIENDRFVRLSNENTAYYGAYVGDGFVLFLWKHDPNGSYNVESYIRIRYGQVS